MVICIPYIYGRTTSDLPPLPLPGSQGHRVTGLRVTWSPDPQGHQTMVSRVTESTDPLISPSPGSPLGVWVTRLTHHQTHPTMGHQTQGHWVTHFTSHHLHYGVLAHQWVTDPPNHRCQGDLTHRSHYPLGSQVTKATDHRLTGTWVTDPPDPPDHR